MKTNSHLGDRLKSTPFLECLWFCGSAWTFKLLPSKHKETRIWHAKPIARTI